MWRTIHDWGVEVGEVVFLADVFYSNRGHSDVREASRTPYAKNMSGERVLNGWCGETNNRNVTADGAAVVTAVSKRDEQRIRVCRLPDTDPRVIALCEELDVTIS